MFNVNEIRKDFPILKTKTNSGNDLIYFDNSATTLKPKVVIDAVSNYYEKMTANVHRGDYDLSHNVDSEYELTRKVVASFINAQKEEIVFTNGATSGINMVSFGLKEMIIKENDEIIISEAEHASNILPWYRVADEKKAKIIFVPLDNEGRITTKNLLKVITPRTKIISLAHVGNVLGYTLDVKGIAKICKEKGIIFVVDGAQGIPHQKIDVKDLDCDFYIFSSHKMLGPSGVGVVYGKLDLLEEMPPFILGGGSNSRFDNLGKVYLKKSPYKFEAGTPAIEGVIGLRKAIEYLNSIGMENIHAYEKELKEYAVRKLKEIKEITIYNENSDSGIIAFNYEGVFAQDLGTHYNSYGIAVRTGQHCAKLLPNHLKTPSIVRASLYFYNTKEEIDKFIEVSKKGSEYLDAYFR